MISDEHGVSIIRHRVQQLNNSLSLLLCQLLHCLNNCPLLIIKHGAAFIGEEFPESYVHTLAELGQGVQIRLPLTVLDLQYAAVGQACPDGHIVNAQLLQFAELFNSLGYIQIKHHL